MAGSTHIPVRTCVACRKKVSKLDMLRVVLKDNQSKIDHKQNLSGRGAYVCNEDCYNKVKDNLKPRLERKRR